MSHKDYERSREIDVPRLILTFFWWIAAPKVWLETVFDSITQYGDPISAVFYFFTPIGISIPVYYITSFLLSNAGFLPIKFLIACFILFLVLAGNYIAYWGVAKLQYYRQIIMFLMSLFYGIAVSLFLSPGGF